MPSPLTKGSLGASVEVLPCDLEVMGSSLGSSLLQKMQARLAYITLLWWDLFPDPHSVGMLRAPGCPFNFSQLMFLCFFIKLIRAHFFCRQYFLFFYFNPRTVAHAQF